MSLTEADLPAAERVNHYKRQGSPLVDVTAVVPFELDAAMAFAKPPAEPLLVRNWGSAGPVRRIIVLKLDHFGDLVIALPALRELRSAFPHAWIRLVCGSWNGENAKNAGVADEVRTFDYFPEHAAGWDGRALETAEAFARAVEGSFDLAIDLRADEDTRHLLGRIDARFRCGIGSQRRFPLLDIALPAARALPAIYSDKWVFSPDRFVTRMDEKLPLHHETRLHVPGSHIVFGPYIPLPPGKYRVTFGLRLARAIPWLGTAKISIDVCQEAHTILAHKIISDRGRTRLSQSLSLDFINTSEGALHEFRVHAAGRRQPWARLYFAGAFLEKLDSDGESARFQPAELHIGELLSLLVKLIKDRTTDLYPSAPWQTHHDNAEEQTIRIVLAPQSNSTIRDWPARYFARLISLLIQKLDCDIVLVGSANQADAAEQIRATASDPSRVTNLAGRTKWSDLPGILTSADLVICNNSGVAHYAASLGVPTLAIYSGSHQPPEWGPRGPRSRALMAQVPCSPCGYEHLPDCPHEHKCMQLITPEIVLGHALELIDQYSDHSPVDAVAQKAPAV